MSSENISNRLTYLNKWEKLALQEFSDQMRETYGDNLIKIILYGSKARGDSTQSSDIDLLIVLKKMGLRYNEIKRINIITSPLCLKYQVLISAFPVREEQVEQSNLTVFMENAIEEGVVL